MSRRNANFSVSRRDALWGNTTPVHAAALSGSVPEVDSLAVRIVVDSYQFAVAPGKTLEGLEIEHFGWGLRPDVPPGRTLSSEFGLCLHVESRRGTQTRNLLVDFGYTPVAELQEVNIDYIVPLHCTGEPFYDQARAAMPGKILRASTGAVSDFHERLVRHDTCYIGRFSAGISK